MLAMLSELFLLSLQNQPLREICIYDQIASLTHRLNLGRNLQWASGPEALKLQLSQIGHVSIYRYVV